MSGGGATSNIFLALTFYIVLTSGIIAFISMENEAILIGDNPIHTLETVDFTDSRFEDFNYKVLLGKWELSETKGLYSIPNSLTGNEITFIRLFMPEKQIFKNRYVINNELNSDYYLIVRKTGLYYDSLFLRVEENWIYLSSGKIPLIPYSYNQVFYHDMGLYNGEYSITTVLNDGDRTVEVYINEVYVFTYRNVPNKNILSWGYVYYNGVGSHDEIGIKEYGTEGKIVTKSEEDGIKLTDFVKYMGAILFWNVKNIPLLLNMVFVKVPILVLIFILVQTGRGSG